MPSGRFLVIDASMDNRIAAELRARERNAIALSQLGLHRLEDDELLPLLHERDDLGVDWVLATADDAMPDEHGDLIAELQTTICTVDPDHPATHDADSWARDVIHRWAHIMQLQAPSTVRRYGLGGHRVWTVRTRRRRRGH